MRGRGFGDLGNPPDSRLYKTAAARPAAPAPARPFRTSPQPKPAPVARPRHRLVLPPPQPPAAVPAGHLGAVVLVTAVSRPGNLLRMHRSAEAALSRSGMSARWIIVADGHGAVPPETEAALRSGRIEVRIIVHGGGACPYGIVQKNLGMDAVGDGYYHCIDDDNIVHPDFFSGLQRAMEANPGRRAFVFGQQRWDKHQSLVASPGRMTLGLIDNTMFAVHSSLIGPHRYDLSKAGSEDFHFFRRLYEVHRDEFVFLPETLAYYNFIRHHPQETPEESARPAPAAPDGQAAAPRVPGVLRIALYSSKRERCGIATYTEQLAAALASMGHDVRHWGSGAPVQAAFAEIRAWGPDVFHVQHESSIMPTEDVLGRHCDELRRNGARVMVTLHTADPAGLRAGRRATASAPGRIIMHMSVPGAADALVMPMPCTSVGALPDRTSSRRRFGLPESGLVVTTVGFMIPWKNHPGIAESLVPWLKSRPDAFLQVIASEHFSGDLRAYAGECRSRLSRISSEVGGRVLHVDGYPSDAEVVDRIAVSDLGYVWCPFDTASSSAAAAQFTSARCPLVATDSSHYALLGTGVVRGPKGDMGAFADLIRRTAGDPRLLASLRANQWDMYRRRNYLETARAHLALYGGGA
jgi:hypothetical protein